MSVIFGLGLALSSHAMADGNTTITSFEQAKRLMQKDIYVGSEYQKTLYCGAAFNMNKSITLPDGFTTDRYKNRLKTYEAEHIVPAQNFGQTFKEWREGDAKCINLKGEFKGRACASKVNTEYRLMQSDLYNLAPAIGAVNAARQNYNFTMLPDVKSDFGSCDMRIEGRKVQPPEQARGRIARTYLYFENAYTRYNMSNAQRNLMKAWDKQYPVTPDECEIGRRIESVQHSENRILKTRCEKAGY